jgi:F-box/leucine-rich repeat protein 2/20
MVRQRAPRVRVQGTITAGSSLFKPAVGLKLVAYDCQHVTWTGVREILSRNADVSITTHTTQLPPLEKNSASSSASSSVENLTMQPRIHIVRSSTFPTQVIQLKCFYTFQPTVEEHTKRVMRGDFVAARRLERKWAEFMMAQEEAGAGPGRRRRQRRLRETQMMHADEEGDASTPGSGVGGGRRRRARSGGCAVM